MKQSRSALLFEKIQNILEARSHPDKNPKIGRVQYLRKYYDRDIANGKNDYTYFISFTDLNKIGINPQNKYGTPTGIYAYPLKLMFNRLIEDTIPFASNRPHIQLLERTSNKILNFDTYSKSDLTRDISKVDDLYGEQLDEIWDNTENKYNYKTWKERIKGYIDGDLEDLDNAGCDYLNIGAEIWFYTMNVAKLIKNKNFYTDKLYMHFWNGILRSIGYEVVIDSGHGIIHPNESCQAVFLQKSAFRHADMIPNKRYSDVSYTNDSKLTDKITIL